MEKFNNFVEAAKNIAIIIATGLAITYWFSYDFEVFFKDRVLNKSHWFYVGDWSSERKIYVQKLYQVHPADHNAANGHITRGHIIRATAEEIVGRTNAGIGMGKVRYIGDKNDCLHALESTEFDTKCGTASCTSIWIRAIPNMCG